MKNIVVFGASGDTGRYFVRYFQAQYAGEEFKIIASGAREAERFDVPGVDYRQVDITRREDFAKLPREVYAVVDLAGLMPARMEGYDIRRHVDVNLMGNLNILEYCREAGADRILFAQSFGDIKDHAQTTPLLRVDMSRKFSFATDHTVYVLCKNFTVDMIEHYHQFYGLKRFIFRLPTIYLYSKEDHYYVDGVRRKIGYRILIDQARQSEDIEVWGDPNRKKDMVYVKDFCQMLYLALFADRSEGYYNVGTGIGTTLLDQIRGIVEVFSPKEHPSKLILRPDKPNAPQYIMDIEPARRELGYEPKYDYLSMLYDFKREMELQSGIYNGQYGPLYR